MRTDLLQELLGDYTDHGEERSFNCPFCERTGRTPDTSEKMWVNERKGMFICYRCETKGSVGFLLRMLGASEEESVEEKASELSKRIRKLQGLPVEEPEFTEGDEDPEVVDYMYEITRNSCVPIAIGSLAWNYLRDRGLSDDDIDFYDIVDGRGRYRNRVIVPTFNVEGDLTYFVSRAYKAMKIKTKSGEYKDAPKYLNPRGEGRRRSVFNLQKALQYDEIVITEGVFSAMATGRNAVATFGKLVTDSQVDLIVTAADGRELIVCLDGDAHEQTVDVARRLHDRGARVSIAILPYEHDPDSIGKVALWGVLESRSPFSTLTVAKLQASGSIRRRKVEPSPRSISTLDSIRAKLLGS